MKAKFLLFILLSLATRHTFAQCFDRFFQQGKDALSELNFEKSRLQFTAAAECDDRPADFDLRVWQDSVQRRYIQTLEDALRMQRKANADVARLILENANRDILRLDYEEALKKIKAADALNALPELVANAYLEIAFWYGESGQSDRAVGVLDTAARAVGNTAVGEVLKQVENEMEERGRELLRDVIRQLNGSLFDSLWVRHYPVIVDVKGGDFTMGAGNESHKAVVSDFQLARTETTFWQYGLFCAATGREIRKPGWGVEGNNPAVLLSWFDALKYCAWLNERFHLPPAMAETGERINLKANGFRLPTEAEWEYASGNGKNTREWFFSGSGVVDDVGWYEANSGSRTQPVGLKKVNDLGIFDMTGNVWEWCWDWYGSYLPNPPRDYTGPDKGIGRVLRGGSWRGAAGLARITYRNSVSPDDRFDNLGFRLARGLE
jgi:formylglycine-generating enzyme required for sulfatase activity